MSESSAPSPAWEETRAHLCRVEPKFFELEPGGALALQLEDEEWILEITPDGQLICQTGIDMEDVMSLLSDGTPEELGTDELAKQAKYYIQPAVNKARPILVQAGFEEKTEMTDQHVAVTFERPVDVSKPEEVTKAVRWCQEQIR
ncbi:MAG: hypothetical protein ACREI3_04815 [Nitrospirales bacterium]